MHRKVRARQLFRKFLRRFIPLALLAALLAGGAVVFHRHWIFIGGHICRRDALQLDLSGASLEQLHRIPELTMLEQLDPRKVFFVVGHKLREHEKYLVQNNRKFDIYCIIPSLMDPKQIRRLAQADIKGIRIFTESQEMGIYKSFNYEIFERRNCTLFAFDGNSSVANLVQEARNGKGKARIFLYPKSAMLKAKAASLEGYVTINAPAADVIRKIHSLEHDIGTKI